MSSSSLPSTTLVVSTVYSRRVLMQYIAPEKRGLKLINGSFYVKDTTQNLQHHLYSSVKCPPQMQQTTHIYASPHAGAWLTAPLQHQRAMFQTK